MTLVVSILTINQWEQNYTVQTDRLCCHQNFRKIKHSPLIKLHKYWQQCIASFLTIPVKRTLLAIYKVSSRHPGIRWTKIALFRVLSLWRHHSKEGKDSQHSAIRAAQRLLFYLKYFQRRPDGLSRRISARGQKPVLKTSQVGPNSLFTLLKGRVWCDLKRLKNRLQGPWQLITSFHKNVSHGKFYAPIQQLITDNPWSDMLSFCLNRPQADSWDCSSRT